MTEAGLVRTRFAPSPNGWLHLGHARSALYASVLAQRLGGRFLVRIEDIDVTRTREEFVTGIFEDLNWLGLNWERPVLRQSEHFMTYQAAAERLRQSGVLYRCFASRSEIAAATPSGARRDPDGQPLYPGLHRDLSDDEQEARISRGEPFAWRLDMQKATGIARQVAGKWPPTYRAWQPNGDLMLTAANPEVWGDAVIVRKDVPASYHLAVVVDDARQGVSHVTRGVDLEPATGLHRLLQVLLGLPEPIYCHHDLILDMDGAKLSKSAGAQSLGELRAAGYSAAQVSEICGCKTPM